MRSKDKGQGIPTSYSTLLTRSQQDRISSVSPAIDKELTIGADATILKQEDHGVLAIIGEMNVPAFAHPIIHGDQVIVDARALFNKKGDIKNNSEYLFLKRRAIMEREWVRSQEQFAAQGAYVVDVFASWFADGLTMRASMPIQTSTQLRILAAVYYTGRLQRESEEDIDRKDIIVKLLRVIPRYTRIPAQVVDDLFTGIEEKIASLYTVEGNSLEALIKVFNDVTADEYEVTTNLVYNALTRNAFVAINAPELVGMAIEVPPLFFLMIEYCLQKGIYRKTTIGQKTDGLSRKHNVRGYQDFMASLLRG